MLPKFAEERGEIGSGKWVHLEKPSGLQIP